MSGNGTGGALVRAMQGAAGLVQDLRNFGATRMDSWANAYTGLGTLQRDRVLGHAPTAVTPLSDQVLDALYHGSWVAERIVGKLPRTAFRKGIELTYSGELEPETKREQEKEILKALEAISALPKFVEAAIWGRTFGCGALLLGAVDGSNGAPEEPLADDELTELRHLTVLDARDLIPEPTVGADVEHYWLTPSRPTEFLLPTRIHVSRFILFGGSLTSERMRQANGGRDLSVLQRVYDTLRSFDANRRSIDNMLSDSSLGVLRLEGFYDVVTGNRREEFNTRMELMQLARWVGRVMPLDRDREEFAWIERAFSGIPQLREQDQQELAGAADMPVCVMLGRSPAGLNATGESDLELWYGHVEEVRKYEYQPGLVRLVRLVARSLKVGDPEAWGVQWPPIRTESAKERAERRKLVADADALYIDRGVLTEDEVAVKRFGGEDWDDGAPQIDLEARAAMAEADRAVAEGRAGPEPEVSEPGAAELEVGDVGEAEGDTADEKRKERELDLRTLDAFIKAKAPDELIAAMELRIAMSMEIDTPEVTAAILKEPTKPPAPVPEAFGGPPQPPQDAPEDEQDKTLPPSPPGQQEDDEDDEDEE